MKITNKNDLINYTITLQDNINKGNYSYNELLKIQNDLCFLARKYGLVKELKENGML